MNNQQRICKESLEEMMHKFARDKYSEDLWEIIAEELHKRFGCRKDCMRYGEEKQDPRRA